MNTKEAKRILENISCDGIDKTCVIWDKAKGCILCPLFNINYEKRQKSST